MLCAAGCDEIDPPYMTNVDGHHGNDGARTVLLEEFTGHQCPNCPEGSQIAHQLAEHYGNRLVIVSVHAGWFASPAPPLFEYNFRTSAGNDLHDYFGVAHYPVGMVSRKPFEGSMLMAPSAWAEAIERLIHTNADFELRLTSQYRETDRMLEVSADVAALSDSGCPYRISVCLTESGIIKPQRTNNPDYPDGVIADYEHNHVLRACINGTWGEPLNEGPILAGDRLEHSYTISVDEEWEPGNLTVVAYIHHADTYEVAQAAAIPCVPGQ